MGEHRFVLAIAPVLTTMKNCIPQQFRNSDPEGCCPEQRKLWVFHTHTHTIMPCWTAYFTIWAVKWYNLLAWLIFILLTKERDFSPLGLSSSRSGSGALRLCFDLIDRARLAVPQGGAKNTPTTRGFFNQLASRSRPLLVVRSTRLTGATQFLGLVWSTPNDDDRPNCLRHAVTLPVPQKISMTKAS